MKFCFVASQLFRYSLTSHIIAIAIIALLNLRSTSLYIHTCSVSYRLSRGRLVVLYLRDHVRAQSCSTAHTETPTINVCQTCPEER